jgi:hypothetical protein
MCRVFSTIISLTCASPGWRLKDLTRQGATAGIDRGMSRREGDNQESQLESSRCWPVRCCLSVRSLGVALTPRSMGEEMEMAGYGTRIVAEV